MENKRYKSICSELDILIEWGVSISNAISGKEAPTEKLFYADQIFSKLLCHAITLRRIIPTGITPNVKETELWDISSTCAITRALIETYDALFYIAIDEISNTENKFRILLWKLHSEERRLKKLELIESKIPEVTTIQSNVKEFRGKVLEHEYFESLNNGIKNKIKKGNSPAYYLSHADRNKCASINHSYYNSCIIFLSAYVHTYPFSIHQLMEFKAGNPESLRLMSMPIQYALGFLAKGIDGMNSMFNSNLPNSPKDVSDLCGIWCGIVENGISKIG